MVDVYTIDFETYYDKEYSLGKLSTQQYIMDPRFEVIGVSIAENGGYPIWHSFDWESEKDALGAYAEVLAPLDDAVVLAHNAMFDVGILTHHFNIKPKLILDTLSMAKPLHGLTVGGSLKALAQKYGIGEKGTEVVTALGKRRADMLADSTLDAYGKYCDNDVILTRDLYGKLKRNTHNDELKVIDATIRMFTEPTLELDADMLDAAIEEERNGKNLSLNQIGLPREFVMSNQKLATLLEALEVEVPTKISPTTGLETYAMAKADKDFVALKDHDVPLVSRLVRARLANKSTINETRMDKFLTLAELGPVWVPLSYCGAVGTWRWSGQDGLNMQNLPSRGDNTIRRAIIAPAGHKLVVVDSSNIELRVNHTLAGQDDVVQALREGRDLYKEFASGMYGVPIDKVTKEQRFVGKVAHLMLGYQGGAVRFKETARQWGGMDISEEEAQNIVTTWRKTYGKVRQMWYNCDTMIKAMHEGTEYVLPSAPFVEAKKGFLTTPPHHFLQFPELSNTDNGYTYKSRRGRGTETVYLYGGKLVENLCQHISRNILAEQLVTISERYKVALMVHDEFVAVVPEDEANDALDWMVNVMSTSPDWWPEIPLAAEGEIADRYGDAK